MGVLKVTKVPFDKSAHGPVEATIYVVKDILVVCCGGWWSWQTIYRQVILHGQWNITLCNAMIVVVCGISAWCIECHTTPNGLLV